MAEEIEGMLERRVAVFLSEFCSVQLEKITPNSDVVRDLKIEGDDAIELMEEFSRKFEVDISDLDLSAYFVPETYFSPLTALWKLITGDAPKLKNLYVKDLVTAASLKRWPS